MKGHYYTPKFVFCDWMIKIKKTSICSTFLYKYDNIVGLLYIQNIRLSSHFDYRSLMQIFLRCGLMKFY